MVGGTIAKLLIKLGVDDKEATAKLGTFGGKANSLVRKGLMPAAATLGVVGIAMKKAGDAASDLVESQNAVRVVFGKSAKLIEDFSKVADRKAGLSMRALNEAVTPIGASMTNMGYTADAAAKSSINLATRAADMASVFNKDVDVALGAIASGLRGESEPLKQFGVNLTEAKTKAYAMSAGIWDGVGKMTEHEKALAREGSLLQQTNKMKGDFVNTIDDEANATRANKAAAENMAAAYGQGVLPVMKMVQNIIRSVIAWMAKHTTTVKILTGVVLALASAIIVANVAMKIATVTMWLLGDSMKRLPIFMVIGLIITLGVALVAAYKKSARFRAIVQATWAGIKRAAQVAWAILRTIFSGIVRYHQIVWNAAKTMYNVIRAAWSKISSAAGNLGRRVSWLKDVARLAFAAWLAPIQVVIGAIGRLVSAAQTAYNAVKKLVDMAGAVGSAAGSIAGKANPFNWFASGGIVTRATPGIVGEAGPEAVIPLNSSIGRNILGGAGGGGGMTIIVQDHTVAGMSPEARRSLARQLAPELRRAVAL